MNRIKPNFAALMGHTVTGTSDAETLNGHNETKTSKPPNIKGHSRSKSQSFISYGSNFMSEELNLSKQSAKKVKFFKTIFGKIEKIIEKRFFELCF